jgi:hypothetical protein
MILAKTDTVLSPIYSFRNPNKLVIVIVIVMTTVMTRSTKEHKDH